MRRAFPLIAFAFVPALAPEVGCVQVPTNGQAPVLATHVQDWRDEVIYQLIVDRFADGDINNDWGVQPGFLEQYQGGDWQGIIDHLGYLQALGVTTLWISPIVLNVDSDSGVGGYHGYWQSNLHELNPHMGDLATLRTLTATAHDRGMKVVLDIVCNHMGQMFFYDMNKNGQPDVFIFGNGSTTPIVRISEFDPDFDPNGIQAFECAGSPVKGCTPAGSGRAPIIFLNDPTINRVPPPDILGTAAAYHGLGRILNYDVEEQTILGDFPGGLKDVATELPEVRSLFIDAFSRWVEAADFDGFRIDTVKHVEHGFWQTFAPAVRQRLAAEGKDNFLMFGEAFDGNDQLLGSYTQNQEMDSVFYFSQHYTAFVGVFENAHDPTGQSGTDQIQALWSQQTTNYATTPNTGGIGVAPYKALVNFIDNHDVARFLYDSQGDVQALRNALTLVFTEAGIPCVYYGTEQEFSGGNDPANREVLWYSNFATGGDTFQHIAQLARIRQGYVALRRGDTTVRWATPHTQTEEDAGIFAFERTGGDAGPAYALVVLNTNDFKASTTANAGSAMKTSAAPGTTLVDVLDPARTTYTVDPTGSLSVTVPAQSGMILVPQGQVVPGI
jgi:alpha-amylase